MTDLWGKSTKHVLLVKISEDTRGTRISVKIFSVSDFLLYFRTATSDEIIDEKTFTLASQENVITSDENSTIYRDYSYLIGGQGGFLPAFTKFQIKIVFRSTNQARVSRIKDIRVIALGV